VFELRKNDACKVEEEEDATSEAQASEDEGEVKVSEPEDPLRS